MSSRTSQVRSSRSVSIYCLLLVSHLEFELCALTQLLCERRLHATPSHLDRMRRRSAGSTISARDPSTLHMNHFEMYELSLVRSLTTTHKNTASPLFCAKRNFFFVFASAVQKDLPRNGPTIETRVQERSGVVYSFLAKKVIAEIPSEPNEKIKNVDIPDPSDDEPERAGISYGISDYIKEFWDSFKQKMSTLYCVIRDFVFHKDEIPRSNGGPSDKVEDNKEPILKQDEVETFATI